GRARADTPSKRRSQIAWRSRRRRSSGSPRVGPPPPQGWRFPPEGGREFLARGRSDPILELRFDFLPIPGSLVPYFIRYITFGAFTSPTLRPVPGKHTSAVELPELSACHHPEATLRA